MDISFSTGKLAKEFNDERALQKNRGKVQAEKIKSRMAQLRGANYLGQLRPPTPGNFHPLGEDKAGWIACHLDGNYRLVFVAEHIPLPELPAGGLDWTKVTAVRVLGVIDYHGQKNTKPI